MPTVDPAAGRAPRLARNLGLFDAVALGLGAMIGAGIFAVLAPAARAAGPGLLWGLLLGAVVAYANATSSAQLAARYPEAGGTYVYATKMIGPFWGYIAGWGFVMGKLASLGAMALTVGMYAFPDRARIVAIVSVAAMAAVDYFGVEKTARATKVLVGIVLGVLAVVVFASLGAPTTDTGHLVVHTSPSGVLRSAGLLFFAFAGYARIATLGEEVVDPARVIPLAIPIALVITLGVYFVVALAALVAVGPDVLGASDAPLVTAAGAAGVWVTPLVRFGATAASLGVLLSLLAAVSRTTLAMARDGHLPSTLAAVHRTHRTPHRAEATVAVIVVGVVALFDVTELIGLSAFIVLAYYAMANLCAWRQPVSERRWPKWLQAVGLSGCVVLAISLPPASVAPGLGVFGVGVLVWLVRRSAGGDAKTA